MSVVVALSISLPFLAVRSLCEYRLEVETSPAKVRLAEAFFVLVPSAHLA